MARETGQERRRSELKLRFAKRLRQEATECERALWSRLRNGQMHGLRFRRQQPIGPFIADFYCSAAKLVVELDGSQHGACANRAYDLERTRFMVAGGLYVLRFSNHDFLSDPEAVLENIGRVVESRAGPLPERAVRVRPSLKGRVE